MKHASYIPQKRSIEHGGIYSLKRRRSYRPIHLEKPLHLTLRSDLAKGSRSLLKNKVLVDRILNKASRNFRIRIYEKAICGNHIHLLVKSKLRRSLKGQHRKDLQNFFRVVAGHIAQEILRNYPLQNHELKSRGGAPGCKKNQRKFWSLLLYSRIVGWGRDYRTVKAYVIQNTREALGLIPYQERKSRFTTANTS